MIYQNPIEMPDDFRPCQECGQNIGWIECPTGSWWAHEVHPDDGHDAAPVMHPTKLHERLDRALGEWVCGDGSVWFPPDERARVIDKLARSTPAPPRDFQTWDNLVELLNKETYTREEYMDLFIEAGRLRAKVQVLERAAYATSHPPMTIEETNNARRKIDDFC